MSILLAGKDPSDSSTKDNIFVKNRGGLWRVLAGVLEIFLIVEKYIDVIFQIDFSIRLHFTTLLNFANEESEDEIALNLLESMLTLYLFARIFKYVSLQKEALKLETSKKKQATKKLLQIFCPLEDEL